MITSRKTSAKIRRIHRYLGVFLGLQFLFWTFSGLYFSWTDIDEIHGDQFRRIPPLESDFFDLIAPVIPSLAKIHQLELKSIAGKPYYWVNDSVLVDARSGKVKPGISEIEALQVASSYMQPHLKVTEVKRITSVGPHHEYRGRSLPAFELSYEGPEELKAYVSERDGQFQTIRYRSWRWFDFLWMTHTMDYQGRDNFNTLLLRVFSLMGLFTVLSGFLLWGVSSPTFRKLIQKCKRNRDE
jgi:hypothetical protein